ncbi:MAG: M48 family metalloprotease, partial [Pseudomonadota bacterium]
VGISVMNRRQEFAADTFALEMLNASGYDPAATLGILEYIQAAEVADKKVKKRYRLSAKSIEGLFSEIAFIGLAELSAAITKSHPSADRRLKSARAHLRKMLGDKDTPAVRTAALNRARSDRQFRNLASFFNEFYKQLNSNSPRSHARVIQLLKTPYGRTASARTQAVTALLQVRPETSLKLLQTATMQSTAPAGYFAIRASIEAGMKKSSDAKRTISRMAARYGWRATYQTALNTAFRLGDAEWTASLLQRCRARGDKKLAQACVTASRGVSSDEQHKVPTILTTLAKTVAPGGAYHGGLSANNGVRVKGVAPGRVSAPVIANNNPLAGLLNAVGANTAAASTNRGRIVRNPTTGTTPANPLGALLNTIGSAVSQ